MSANQSSLAEGTVADRRDRSLLLGRRLRWALWAAALVAGIGIGVVLASVHLSHPAAVTSGATPPVETWAAGVRRAPAFSLTDQHGKPVSLTGLRGRPVIVTFIDPLCRNFCPREARVLSDAAKSLEAERPAIVAVSVNPWANSAANFRLDALRWRLGPQWRWGVGTATQLAAVWRGYQIGVRVDKQVIAGVTIRKITHTEAAYLIDAAGNERALLVYPFTARDVVAATRHMLAAS